MLSLCWVLRERSAQPVNVIGTVSQLPWAITTLSRKDRSLRHEVPRLFWSKPDVRPRETSAFIRAPVRVAAAAGEAVEAGSYPLPKSPSRPGRSWSPEAGAAAEVVVEVEVEAEPRRIRAAA